VAEVPPVYVEFKGDTTNLNSSIRQAQTSLNSFGNTTKEVGAVARKMGVAQIALGGIIANMATAATANVKEFAMSFVGEYQHIAGEVRSLSKVMDGTPEQISVISFAARRFGIDSAQLSLGIRTLSKGLVSNSDTIKSLGIEYRDSNGRLLPTIDIINNLADRYKTLPSKIEQNAFAMAAFGRAGKNMAPLLGLGSEGIKELGLSAQELGMVMSGQDLTAVKDYGFAQKDLKEAIDGVKVTIGRDLLPILAQSASALNETLIPALKTVVSAFTNSGFGGGVRQAQDSLQTFIAGLDGVQQAVYQLILMFVSFKTSMAALQTTQAIWDSMKSGIDRAKNAMELYRYQIKLGATSWQAFGIAARGALIATGIGILLVALGLVVEYLMNAYMTSETFRDKVNGVFKSVAAQAAKLVNAILKVYNAFARIMGLKEIGLVSWGGGEKGTREDIASAYGIKTSGQQDPDFGTSGLDNFGKVGTTGKTAEKKKTAFEKFVEGQRASLSTLGAKLQLNNALTDDLGKEANYAEVYKKQVKAMYDAAVTWEKKTRKTAEHADAQEYLNEMMGTYASAITSAASAQEAYNRQKENDVNLTKSQIDEQNRLFQAMQRNRESSRSWLAATSRASGPTQANFGGFIEVPVVIDGQTVFRATQKYSLINNRRNVTNGLATSGSLI
jgi:hypothetical protein